MDMDDKRLAESFRRVKSDIFSLEKQILEIARRQEQFMDIVNKLQGIESELIKDVEKVVAPKKKSSKRKSPRKK